jgi:N-acyl-L-homoserine lactone synthetase
VSSTETELAIRQKVLDSILRLRYRVYCLEQEFIDVRRCPDGREVDEHDAHSVHIAGVDEQGDVAATARLVLDSPAGFPLDRHADAILPEFRGLPRDRSTEISRLIIDGRHPIATRLGRPLLLGLLRELYREGRRRGVEHVLAAMEPGLARLLERLGFGFVAIGSPIQHLGEVIPYYAHIESFRPGYRRIVAHARQMAEARAQFRFLKVPPTRAEAA